jgi:hypothetical protein
VLVGVLFGRMLCRRGWSFGWMLCHLCLVVDLYNLDAVVSFSRFSCLVGVRFVGSSVFCPLFLLFFFLLLRPPVICLVAFCISFNSLCLLRFVMIVLLFS